VEQHVVPTADLTDRRDVLDDARLVVDMHDRDELGFVAERLLQSVETDPAGLVGVQPGDIEALFLQRVKYVGHRLVFRRHGNEVLASVLPITRGTRDREVVGLGSARCPDQLIRPAAQKRCKLPGSVVDQRPGAPAGRVIRRRIGIAAIDLREACHRVCHLGIERGRCRKVQVDHLACH
jgi:hypothetical protein